MATSPTSTPKRLSYLSLNPLVPLPEESPKDYDTTKVKQRLEYSKHIGRRNISPRSEIFLQLYQEAAENALLMSNDNDRMPYYTRLYRYDRFMQANSFICKDPGQQQRDLEEKLLKLKRLEYYARYGDYLARELSFLREAAKMAKTVNHEELQQYWTTINTKMQNERTIYKGEGGKTDTDKIPTLLAVWNVAMEVNLPTERVEWVIEQYAERNLLVHSAVSELIQIGRWTGLAEILYNDAKDLAVTIPPSMKEDIANLSATISSLRQKFFLIDSGDEDSPWAWRATPDAVKYRNELRTKAESKAQAKAKLVEETVKRANQAVKLMEKQAELSKQAIQNKRKASQPFPLGEEILAKKIKEMEKVVGIQVQVRVKEQELGRLYAQREKAVNDMGNHNIG